VRWVYPASPDFFATNIRKENDMSIQRKQLVEVRRVVDAGEQHKLSAIKAFNKAAERELGKLIVRTPRIIVKE
jgi:hypothetical protein